MILTLFLIAAICLGTLCTMGLRILWQNMVKHDAERFRRVSPWPANENVMKLRERRKEYSDV